MSQYHFPPPTPETLTPHAAANHLGISRIGFEVDDIDAAYGTLLAADPIGAGPAVAGPPEEWDYGPEVGRPEGGQLPRPGRHRARTGRAAAAQRVELSEVGGDVAALTNCDD